MTSVAAPHFSTLIVGAGFAGLSMAITLRKQGVADFVLIEKAAELGGTWRENTYPGCACDVQSHLYSYSFRLNPDWSTMYAGRSEIQQYLSDTADAYGLRDHIRFNTRFDSARFDDDAGVWHVATSTDEEIVVRNLVVAQGPLHRPRRPEVPGLGAFGGRSFHSSQWDHDCDLRGKRVAVIGTGASAVQFIPRIADQVESLTLVQRTPAWVIPRLDRKVTDFEKRLFSALPVLQRLYRCLIYWRNETRVVAMRYPKAAMALEWIGRRHIRRSIKDESLADRLTPRFTMGCKRILLSNDYYPALARDNVDVVTQSLSQVVADGIIVEGGRRIAVDAIIYGTGFQVSSGFETLQVRGRHGRELRRAWSAGPSAYLGTTVAGFPNLYLMLGPNTGLGHNSMIFMIEAQTRYIAAAMALLRGRGARQLEVRQAVEYAFTTGIRRRLSRSVWSTGGCHSWYVDADGVNRTLWPGFTVGYWWRTRRVDPSHYTLTH